MADKLWVFDTTLRDGEQVPGCQLNTREKIVVAQALEALGVDILEAGFPISSPGDFNSVMEISKAVSEPIICALSRAVEKDIQVAADSLRFAKKSRIHTGIGVSGYHIQHKLRSTPQAVMERAVNAVKFARNLVGEVEFYAEDAGRADPEYLASIIEAVIAAGKGSKYPGYDGLLSSGAIRRYHSFSKRKCIQYRPGNHCHPLPQ